MARRVKHGDDRYTLTWVAGSEREVQIEIYDSLFEALDRERGLRREGYGETEILAGDVTSEDIIGG